MQSFTQKDLDEMTCAKCGSDGCGEGLALAPKCHIRAGMELMYKDGELLARCIVCKKPTGKFLLAKEPE